ncbi:MAG TPA: glycosyltransferase [Ilumatobacteraceae bacterium]|nr:glycosyltransferase [Ilumatobacteraceae bacterium]
MTATMDARAAELLDKAPPALDVVVPVFNEEADLGPSVRRLHRYLSESLPFTFRITIADNASTDGTGEVAARLVDELAHVVYMRVDEKGRGRALRSAWGRSDATVLAYMDVDLSTDLAAVLPLIAPLLSGHSDLAIGSRLARGSNVVRGVKRELISRCYNVILRGTLAARFSDAQCGFKAIRRDVALELLPLIEDNSWFFDTELLVLAQRCGLRIHEVPVDWVDDPDSRVDIRSTAIGDLKGVARLVRGFATGSIKTSMIRRRFGRPVEGPTERAPTFGLQVLRFGVIGIASTIAYAFLFLLFRQALGSQMANLVALCLTAVGNTAANRRITFGVHGAEGVLRHQLQGLLVFLLGLALTSGSLALLTVAWPAAPASIELAVLILANLVTTVGRFLAFRLWVFPNSRAYTEIGTSP